MKSSSLCSACWVLSSAAYPGVLAANRLTNYPIQELEKKVDKHNTVIERTYRLEEMMKVANNRLSDLERHEEQHTHYD